MNDRKVFTKETGAMIAVILVILILMYFLEIRKIGYAIKEFDGVSSCGIMNEAGIYTITNDINTDATCFLIVEDNITLDFRNHILQGDGGSGDFGILVQDADNIVIKNGIIENFHIGILLNKSKNSLIANNQIENHFDSGLILVNGSGNEVNDNIFLRNSYYGIKLTFSSENEVVRNTMYENGDSGLLVHEGKRNNISRNVVSLNEWNGISLYKSSENLLVGNIIRKNAWNSISLVSSFHNQILEGILEEHQREIYLFSSENNTFAGISFQHKSADPVLYISNSNANVFKNIEIRGGGEKAISIVSSNSDQASHNFFQDITGEGNVYSRTGPESQNLGNIFLNVEYENEEVTDSSKNNLIRKWWLDAYVIDGKESAEAIIEIQDHLGNISQLHTDNKGYLKIDLIDYVKTPDKKDEYQYRINAISKGRTISKIIEMNGNLVEIFQFAG